MIPFYSKWKRKRALSDAIFDEVYKEHKGLYALRATLDQGSIDKDIRTLRKKYGSSEEDRAIEKIVKDMEKPELVGQARAEKNDTKKRWMRAKKEKEKGLRDLLKPELSFVPNPSRMFVRSIYRTIQMTTGTTNLEKIVFTGHCSDVIDRAFEGGLVICMDHYSMEDVVTAAYPFLDTGFDAPVFHGGYNLYKRWNRFALSLGGAIRVLRSQKKDSRTEEEKARDRLIYYKTIEMNLDKVHVVFPEGTRRRKGIMGPLRSGFMRYFIRAKKATGKPVYWCTASISQGFNWDVRDFQKEKKGLRSTFNIDTLLRLITVTAPRAIHPEARIYVNFSPLYEISESDVMKRSIDMLIGSYRKKMRKSLDENRIIIPETMSAIALRHFVKFYDGPDDAEGKKDAIKTYFLRNVVYAIKKKVPMDPLFLEDIDKAYDIGMFPLQRFISHNFDVNDKGQIRYLARNIKHHFEGMDRNDMSPLKYLTNSGERLINLLTRKSK